MKIVIVHGQNHKGSTYHVAHTLAEKLNGTITEFFLPKDFGAFCVGCTQCFMQSETKCPHFAKLQPITKAIDEADVIILASPVYVYHATGSMKAWLDHYGYQWMVHRPKEIMFEKQAVCIATTAGAGTKTATADMADSLFFWGVGKVYRYGVNVFATSWNRIKDDKKTKIEHDTTVLAGKIKRNYRHVKPSLKTKAFFQVAKMVISKDKNSPDYQYWNQKGWFRNSKPWED
ncbi:MAG: NAD(P)H-dependent oxidoreductase [Oscillospiraceae bacterium]